jgi:hypothetical protein
LSELLEVTTRNGIYFIWCDEHPHLPTTSFSIVRISHPELQNHLPQPIRFTALDHLKVVSNLEGSPALPFPSPAFTIFASRSGGFTPKKGQVLTSMEAC